MGAEHRHGIEEEAQLERDIAVWEQTVESLQHELLVQREAEMKEEDESRRLEGGLQHAETTVRMYQEWSLGVHDELLQVASELREDERARAQESKTLQERAADLERRTGGCTWNLGRSEVPSKSRCHGPSKVRSQSCAGSRVEQPEESLSEFACDIRDGDSASFSSCGSSCGTSLRHERTDRGRPSSSFSSRWEEVAHWTSSPGLSWVRHNRSNSSPSSYAPSGRSSFSDLHSQTSFATFSGCRPSESSQAWGSSFSAPRSRAVEDARFAGGRAMPTGTIWCRKPPSQHLRPSESVPSLT